MNSFADLRGALLAIDGIPKLEYLVQDGRVFCFDALATAVFRLKTMDDTHTSLAALTARALPEAWMSPQEAVREWDLNAEPYRIFAREGHYSLVHDVFGARLPTPDLTADGAKQLMSRLLVGATIGGEGEFSYRGQQMCLMEPIGTAGLPRRPPIDVDKLPHPPITFAQLAELRFEPRFEPLTEAVFEDVQLLDAICADDCAKIENHAYSRCRELERLAGRLIQWPVDAVGSNAMRQAYALACDKKLCWPKDEADGFVFFQIGAAIFGDGYSPERILFLGEAFSFLLLQGADCAAAKEQALAWLVYVEGVRHRAFRIARIAHWLREDRSRATGMGRSLQLEAEMFQVLRKHSGQDALGTLGADGTTSATRVKGGTVVITHRASGARCTRFVRACRSAE